MHIIDWLLTTTSFSISQMFVFSISFASYEQFDLDIIPKVTGAIFILNLADLNGHKKSSTSKLSSCYGSIVVCLKLFQVDIVAYLFTWNTSFEKLKLKVEAFERRLH